MHDLNKLRLGKSPDVVSNIETRQKVYDVTLVDYNGKALEMNVLERYKTMINDDEYIEYISNNQEALDLSNQIVRSLS